MFVGLDASLEKTAICVISEHGKIVKNAQVVSEPKALLRWIGDQDGEVAAITYLRARRGASRSSKFISQ